MEGYRSINDWKMWYNSKKNEVHVVLKNHFKERLNDLHVYIEESTTPEIRDSIRFSHEQLVFNHYF